MKHFLTEIDGKFYGQQLSSLPVWTSDDEGRLILVVNGTEKNMYFGTDVGWNKLSPGPTSSVSNLRIAVFDGTEGSIKQGSANAYIDTDGYIYGDRVYDGVWNDIADFIEVPEDMKVEYGKVYIIDENENIKPSFDYCQQGIIGVASDTYGFGLGKSDIKKLPISIGGFVLAHVDRLYPPGTPLTSTRNGYLTKMEVSEKLTYPERMVGIFFKKENGSTWNNIIVDGRHWVKVI